MFHYTFLLPFLFLLKGSATSIRDVTPYYRGIHINQSAIEFIQYVFDTCSTKKQQSAIPLISYHIEPSLSIPL